MADLDKNAKAIVNVKLDFLPTELLHGIDLTPEGIEKAIEDAAYEELSMALFDVCDDYVRDIISEGFCDVPDAFFRNIKVLADQVKFNCEQAKEWQEDNMDESFEEDDPDIECYFRVPYLVPCELNVHGFLCDYFGGEKRLEARVEELELLDKMYEAEFSGR